MAKPSPSSLVPTPAPPTASTATAAAHSGRPRQSLYTADSSDPIKGEPGLAVASIANNAWLSEVLGMAGGLANALPGKSARGRPGLTPLRLNPVDLVSCRVVWRLVTELFVAACGAELPAAMARRRPHCHMRQIAMYLSHVMLSLPYQTIAAAFGLDRTTVVHACAVIEDRRDDLAYDRFIERCERCIMAVFQPFGQPHGGR